MEEQRGLDQLQLDDLQGAGGAMMVPVGRLVLLRTAAKTELVAAMAWLTVPALLGPVLGPPVGGFIVTYFNWRWIFDINVPIGILGIVLVSLFVEDIREPSRGRFDMIGLLFCGIALAGLMFGLETAGRGVVPPGRRAGGSGDARPDRTRTDTRTGRPGGLKEDTMTRKTTNGKKMAVKETAQEIYLAGLGAVAVAGEEGSKLFVDLVRKGRALEKTGRAKVEDAVDQAMARARGIRASRVTMRSFAGSRDTARFHSRSRRIRQEFSRR